MQRENNTRRPRQKIVTITYGVNAGSVLEGDRVTYQPADAYQDGERVVLEQGTGVGWRVAYIFNVKGERRRFKYHVRVRESPNRGRNREMLRGDERDPWQVRGVVVKVRTPYGTPKSKTASDEQPARTSTIHTPVGARPQDKFEAVVLIDDSLSDIGVQGGDKAIVFLTTDIKGHDLVLLRQPGVTYVGKYLPTRDGGFRVDPLNDGYETEAFGPGEAEIVGRVTHFERDGRVIAVKMKLRPVCQPHPDKETRIILSQLEGADPVFSITPDGKLRIREGGAR